ncbi:MAG TPA: hypothetical protein VI603_00020 [Saprospiraceae bacterium]|nr:hypothetical protein [Saprospiraceae bacterium]
MAPLINVVYAVYIVFIAAATIYVARTLFSNSKTFMYTIFNGREDLALATNKLFETGFFLLAFGIGLWFLETRELIGTHRRLFEVLSLKTGGFTIFLGILLFFNLYLFFRGMKHRRKPAEVVVEGGTITEQRV